MACSHNEVIQDLEATAEIRMDGREIDLVLQELERGVEIAFDHANLYRVLQIQAIMNNLTSARSTFHQAWYQRLMNRPRLLPESAIGDLDVCLSISVDSYALEPTRLGLCRNISCEKDIEVGGQAFVHDGSYFCSKSCFCMYSGLERVEW